MVTRLPIELYHKLLTAERQLTDIVPEIAKAEECGIDCQAYRSALQVQLETIANLKKNYTPAG